MEIVQSVRWSDDGGAVHIIDQRLLPERDVERDLRTLEDVCHAIRTLAVRGAPAIGIAGAMGLAPIASALPLMPRADLLAWLHERAETIRCTRPTAVNLPWALDRMLRCAHDSAGEMP